MEFVIILAVLASVAIPIWGIIDAAQRPQAAWDAAGQNKTLWIVLQAAGLFFCGIGTILAIVYLAAIRPQVARVA